MGDPLLLTGLRGHNPLGLLAALGALDVAARQLPDRRITLCWTDELEPQAVLAGPDSIEHLVELCDRDRAGWGESPVLRWPVEGKLLDDVKTTPDDLRAWAAHVREQAMAAAPAPGWRASLDLFAGLVAEGALAGKGDTKPTHLHFTAGQQKFLVMVRSLQAGVDRERFHEALGGPWGYNSTLPSLGWDARGERIHALRGFDPSKEKRSGVPGADWLAFLGLRFFPVSVSRGQLSTTGCSGSWKEGFFTWPLWRAPLGRGVVAGLVADQAMAAMTSADRARLGVHHLLRSPIRRSEQGGYGSFGPSGPVLAPRNRP